MTLSHIFQEMQTNHRIRNQCSEACDVVSGYEFLPTILQNNIYIDPVCFMVKFGGDNSLTFTNKIFVPLSIPAWIYTSELQCKLCMKKKKRVLVFCINRRGTGIEENNNSHKKEKSKLRWWLTDSMNCVCRQHRFLFHHLPWLFLHGDLRARPEYIFVNYSEIFMVQNWEGEAVHWEGTEYST